MRKTLPIHLLLVTIGMMVSLQMRAQDRLSYFLVMRTTTIDTMWDGRPIKIFGFAPNILESWLPGPVLYANEGDTLDVRVLNFSQGAPHTVHWHGMDVDQNNDGVAHTSFALGHMQDTNYVFPAQHAGTYMYHCHVHSVLHMQMGMYGPIVVRPADGSKSAWTGGPAYDKEYLWMAGEFDSWWHDSLSFEHIEHPDTFHDEVQVAPYNPDYFLVNGKSEWQLADSSIAVHARVAEKVYLRLINIGYTIQRYVFPANVGATVIESDGRPLPSPVLTDTVELYPGERYGVMLTPTATMDSSVALSYYQITNDTLVNTQHIPLVIAGHIGVDDGLQDDFSFRAWPVPATDKLNVSWENLPQGKGTLTLTDMQGRILHSWSYIQLFASVKTVSVSDLPAGLYSLSFSHSRGTVTKRIAILR
jgi:FtsP/CotA-like multicopper oxidase with cupredoxin domain